MNSNFETRTTTGLFGIEVEIVQVGRLTLLEIIHSVSPFYESLCACLLDVSGVLACAPWHTVTPISTSLISTYQVPAMSLARSVGRSTHFFGLLTTLKVFQVKKKETRRIYAMKVVRKGIIIPLAFPH